MSNGNDALQRAERYLETAAFILEDVDLETAVRVPTTQCSSWPVHC